MTQLNPFKINLYLIFKLPSAFICGVRVKHLSLSACQTTVRHRWINQNPFNSLYFAVQAMAAELSTGALLLSHIRQSNAAVSMLIISNRAVYSRRATGRITFSCNHGQQIAEAVDTCITGQHPVTLWINSIGTNKNGEVVSEMDFEWTIKLRSR